MLPGRCLVRCVVVSIWSVNGVYVLADSGVAHGLYRPTRDKLFFLKKNKRVDLDVGNVGTGQHGQFECNCAQTHQNMI